jgi:multiple sugar transport system substrate-binding protein
MIPARQSVRDAGALEGLPQESIAETIDSMRFLPPIPGIGQVQAETLEIAVADGVQGTTTPSEALKKAADSATQLMDDNKASFGG